TNRTNTPPRNRRKYSQLPAPSSLVFMYDGSTQSPLGTALGDFRGKYRIMGRHGSPVLGPTGDASVVGQTNVAFFDGHSDTVARKPLPNNFNELYDATGGITLKRTSGHAFPLWRLDEAQ